MSKEIDSGNVLGVDKDMVLRNTGAIKQVGIAFVASACVYFHRRSEIWVCQRLISKCEGAQQMILGEDKDMAESAHGRLI